MIFMKNCTTSKIHLRSIDFNVDTHVFSVISKLQKVHQYPEVTELYENKLLFLNCVKCRLCSVNGIS